MDQWPNGEKGECVQGKLSFDIGAQTAGLIMISYLLPQHLRPIIRAFKTF